jgi:hypothetical protein
MASPCVCTTGRSPHHADREGVRALLSLRISRHALLSDSQEQFHLVLVAAGFLQARIFEHSQFLLDFFAEGLAFGSLHIVLGFLPRGAGLDLHRSGLSSRVSVLFKPRLRGPFLLAPIVANALAPEDVEPTVQERPASGSQLWERAYAIEPRNDDSASLTRPFPTRKIWVQ